MSNDALASRCPPSSHSCLQDHPGSCGFQSFLDIGGHVFHKIDYEIARPHAAQPLKGNREFVNGHWDNPTPIHTGMEFDIDRLPEGLAVTTAGYAYTDHYFNSVGFTLPDAGTPGFDTAMQLRSETLDSGLLAIQSPCVLEEQPCITQHPRAICPSCQATFARKGDMIRHARKHNPTMADAFKCPFPECRGKGFPRNDKLLAHLRTAHRCTPRRSTTMAGGLESGDMEERGGDDDRLDTECWAKVGL